MRRIGAVIVLAILVVTAKFGGLIPLPWEQLRIVAELAMGWLIYDLVRSPVTQFIASAHVPPQFSKMAAVRAARISGQPIRLHLKSGEMRQGFVVGHSLSHGSFVLSDSPNDYSIQRHYQADEVDELIVTTNHAQPIINDEAAEGAT